MAKTISVRLDVDAQRALRHIQDLGLTQSEAIRQALLDKSEQLSSPESLAAESAALEANEEDRAERREIMALMEEISAPW